LVSEASTLRRHMQAKHKICIDFLRASSLLCVSTSDRQFSRPSISTTLSTQPSLDTHVIPKEQVLHYSESAFREVAIRWLIETDQVHSI
ncbi:hypothetical protein EDD15DRAFT_2179423, partial [Pisolithus albus]